MRCECDIAPLIFVLDGQHNCIAVLLNASRYYISNNSSSTRSMDSTGQLSDKKAFFLPVFLFTHISITTNCSLVKNGSLVF